MHSKIEIADILIADKLGRSTIYKELERRTHETWTYTNYRLDYMKKKKFIFIILVIVVVIVIGILTQNRSIRVNIITVVIRMIIMVCVRMW